MKRNRWAFAVAEHVLWGYSLHVKKTREISGLIGKKDFTDKRW
jgi:hypothetical protein